MTVRVKCPRRTIRLAMTQAFGLAEIRVILTPPQIGRTAPPRAALISSQVTSREEAHVLRGDEFVDFVASFAYTEMMKNVSAIRYVDARYFKKNENGFKHANDDFRIFIAVGEVVMSENKDAHVRIVFTADVGDTEKPERGILIPLSAILFENPEQSKPLKEETSDHLVEGSSVGVWWRDIVYFDEGNVPDECTQMYTEGTLAKSSDDRIVVANPTTLKTSGQVANHPADEDISLIIIPKVLVKDVTVHG